ncbi:MAG: hypothetical protein H6590_01225 [Flavobacteriales bacterium]|nr:hypothetical protein [Flavobacteriales bacterium]MCB9178033.1 hypothetical protein [Flavobacteriales bacterium]
MTLLICTSALACRVHLVAQFDLHLLEQTEEASRQVDRFYLTMAAADEELVPYTPYKLGYIDIEVLLRSVLDQNRVRQHNEETTRIAESCLAQWMDYARQHREASTLKKPVIALNRKTMVDHLHVLYVAEKVKSSLKD